MIQVTADQRLGILIAGVKHQLSGLFHHPLRRQAGVLRLQHHFPHFLRELVLTVSVGQGDQLHGVDLPVHQIIGALQGGFQSVFHGAGVLMPLQFLQGFLPAACHMDLLEIPLHICDVHILDIQPHLLRQIIGRLAQGCCVLLAGDVLVCAGDELMVLRRQDNAVVDQKYENDTGQDRHAGVEGAYLHALQRLIPEFLLHAVSPFMFARFVIPSAYGKHDGEGENRDLHLLRNIHFTKVYTGCSALLFPSRYIR